MSVREKRSLLSCGCIRVFDWKFLCLVCWLVAIFGVSTIDAFVLAPNNLLGAVVTRSSNGYLPNSAVFNPNGAINAPVLAFRSRRRFNMSSQSTDSAKTNILFQKIVRPNKDLPPALFLGYLVDYLQDHFELPSNLPMVYERSPSCSPNTNDVDEEDNNSQAVIVSWDSPLGDETRLDVEVVGIYTDQEEENDSVRVPNMAMVVVSKAASREEGSTSPPMMQNLFADSEKRILKALDRGLDDFQHGKIPLEDWNVEPASPAERIRTVQDAIDAEIIAETEPVSTETSRVALDSLATADTSSKTTSTETVPSVSSEQEYAVQAAKEAAAARGKMAQGQMGQEAKETKSLDRTPAEDYAVQAAKRAAAAQQKQKRQNANSKQTKKVSSQPVRDGDKALKANIREANKKLSVSGSKPLRMTISTPKQRARKATGKASKELVKRDGVSNAPSKQSKVSIEATNNIKQSDAPMDKLTDAPPESSFKTKRAINVSVQKVDNPQQAENQLQKPFESMSETFESQDGSNSTTPRTVSKAQMEKDVVEAAQKVMADLANDGELSPEELLQDIMKFGEKQEEDNAVGRGFVSGAFEKAKEILKEQKKNREVRLGLQERGFKEVSDDAASNGLRPDILDPRNGEKPEGLSAEEELKRIFEAGERLADGRMDLSSSAETSTAEMSTSEQAQVDALIRGEKSVSGYARSLDEELAELEVRINKSPGEEFDGPPRNPVFDVFSGPEVYNPNVDPETAVNWPGALPGSKDVRLPKELGEAVKQAKFASDVLVNMKEAEGSDGKTFVIGESTLSEQQVQNLRTVVNEAVKIGLIDDPLHYLAEQSRLQMVVDELMIQPEERFREVASNFKDLLLSDNFVSLIKKRLEAMADRDLDARRQDDSSLEEPHAKEREILGQLVVYAQLLLKEARALGSELESTQIELIRSICQVAMDPDHKTEEETATALTDAVRDMRPLLDDVFVAYLKYAVAEEEGRLARAGLLDDPEHNEWLFVLKIVQQGVYAEIARGINRYIEHISYVLRMGTVAERRMLLSKLIDDMPTMDVRPFVQVVDNIAASLGESARGEFDGGYVLGEMTNELLQLHRDVHELLPPERIELMSRDADEWAQEKKRKLMEQRNLTRQRLKAASDTEEYDEEIRRRGELERIE